MKQAAVVFVANRGYALTNSRRALIQRFLSLGWMVIIATADDAESRELCQDGACLEPVDFNRGGVSPGADLKSYRRLRQIFQKWQPSLVQQFHAKPVVFGTLAARHVLGTAVTVVNTITGLGHAFITGGIAARLAGLGYAATMRKADAVVFQNLDDRALFLERKWVAEDKARLIASSGVDVRRFSMVDRRGQAAAAPVVVMIGRLLRQKGMFEFAEVARRVRQRLPDTRFVLAGEVDPTHPDAVPAEWPDTVPDIEYVGRLSDVRPLLAQSSLLLFPSYREGSPRVVLEAGASGLPAVAFDVPGVRDVIRDGRTGYLVDHGDIEALTERVLELLECDDRRLEMGLRSRRLVEDEFDVRAVEAQYLALYRELEIDVD